MLQGSQMLCHFAILHQRARTPLSKAGINSQISSCSDCAYTAGEAFHVGNLCLPAMQPLECWYREQSICPALSLLHTDRIENRGRGLELNRNIPPEPAPSCTEVQALSATDKKKKQKQRISSFLFLILSIYLIFLPHLHFITCFSYTALGMTLFDHFDPN